MHNFSPVFSRIQEYGCDLEGSKMYDVNTRINECDLSQSLDIQGNTYLMHQQIITSAIYSIILYTASGYEHYFGGALSIQPGFDYRVNHYYERVTLMRKSICAIKFDIDKFIH